MATKTEAAHEVRKVLQSVKNYLDAPGQPKLTEADTRAHFIDPMLRALGYSSIGDIQHEVFVPSAKQYLDYRLVVEGKPRVAVEAKAIDVSLAEVHGAQVVQYCSVLGDEWAVVTNGRQWQLYHAFTKAALAEKLLLSVDLVEWGTDVEFEAVFDQLWLVSKESFVAGDGPASWVMSQKLEDVLRNSLTDPASAEVKYLKKRLSDQGIAATPEQIVTWLKPRLGKTGVGNASSLSIGPQIPSATHSSPAGASSKSADSPAPFTPSDPAIHLITPVRDEGDVTVRQTLESLLGQGLYVFGNRTAGRGKIKGGDRICFYASGVGVVADAEIASKAELRHVAFVKAPDKYPWAFMVRRVRYYFEDPVVIDVGLRAELDAFKGKDPAGNWAWFVQGTGYVTAHDYRLLTRR